VTVGRQAAEHEPIARVLPMLTVPHLDREFDYLVASEMSDDAQPGVRVKVRFNGRLVDAFVLERRSETDHGGRLGWLEKVVSAQPVLTHDVRRLVDAVAARYAGTRADVLRLAIPPRHATVEKRPAVPLDPHVPADIDAAAWSAYSGGTQFIAALRDGRAARAVWQALPGDDWPARLAEAAAVTVRAGRSVLAVVHDLSLAARYADRLIWMQHGRIVADGTPAETLTPERLRDVFGVEARVGAVFEGRSSLGILGPAP